MDTLIKVFQKYLFILSKWTPSGIIIIVGRIDKILSSKFVVI